MVLHYEPVSKVYFFVSVSFIFDAKVSVLFHNNYLLFTWSLWARIDFIISGTFYTSSIPDWTCGDFVQCMPSRTFLQPGFRNFTLVLRARVHTDLAWTFWQGFGASSIRTCLHLFLDSTSWLSSCRSCVSSFLSCISVREVSTPRVAIPFGPTSDPGGDSPSSTGSSDISLAPWFMRRRTSITERGHIAIQSGTHFASSFSCCKFSTTFSIGFFIGACWILWILLAWVIPLRPLLRFPMRGTTQKRVWTFFRQGMSLQTLIQQMFMDNCHWNHNFKLVPVVFMRGPSAEKVTLLWGQIQDLPLLMHRTNLSWHSRQLLMCLQKIATVLLVLGPFLTIR